MYVCGCRFPFGFPDSEFGGYTANFKIMTCSMSKQFDKTNSPSIYQNHTLFCFKEVFPMSTAVANMFSRLLSRIYRKNGHCRCCGCSSVLRFRQVRGTLNDRKLPRCSLRLRNDVGRKETTSNSPHILIWRCKFHYLQN